MVRMNRGKKKEESVSSGIRALGSPVWASGRRKLKRTCFIIGLCLALLAGCGQAGRDSPAADGALSAIQPKEFADIDGHTQETYILEGLERGFYSIPPDGRYRPDEAATTAEFAAALWNLAGQPGADRASSASSDAEGVADRAMAWVREAGYEPPDAPGPEEPVTRLAAMELLFAYSGGVSGVEAMFTRLYDDGFEDSGDIPPAGKAAIYWGYYNVLIRETERYRIAPFDTVSRGDMAEILVRCADAFQSGPPESIKEE